PQLLFATLHLLKFGFHHSLKFPKEFGNNKNEMRHNDVSTSSNGILLPPNQNILRRITTSRPLIG
ncbi:hypothetical protein PSY31_23930, partial [Shigella flexneri]|nr:hypothetical protein [Shigella flexneri]